MLDLFIVAGETSGDLLGSKLICELLNQNPSLQIGAVAGPQMRKYPIRSLFRMEKLQVMGFIDVFLSLPKIMIQFFQIRKAILTTNPQIVIFIDYPGLNLRLARSLRKKGFKGKIVHYICPTVWAWGKKRIPLMEENLDLLLTLFPFEKKCFSNKLRVEYVGHPLVSEIPSASYQRKNLLAIFPGSRTSEIKKNLPLQIEIAKELQKQDRSLEVAISLCCETKQTLIYNLAKNFCCTFVSPEERYTLMRQAKQSLATSGTVTLELALHGTPTIVNYAIARLDLFLAQKIFRINLPFYCIVNIIAGKEIFPELFGPYFTKENVLQAIKTKQINPEEIRTILGGSNASKDAATHILSLYTERT
jgi:lipid-A-disaccharide synthase